MSKELMSIAEDKAHELFNKIYSYFPPGIDGGDRSYVLAEFQSVIYEFLNTVRELERKNLKLSLELHRQADTLEEIADKMYKVINDND